VRSKLYISRFFILSLLITKLSLLNAFSQEKKDSLTPQKDTVSRSDSITKDSLKLITTDSLLVKKDTTLSEDAIESKVEQIAKDSIRIDLGSKKMFLYEDAQVNYEQIQLNADYVEVDLNNTIVIANGIEDSSGKMVGLPIFKEGAQEYKAGKIAYNYNTKKGKISEVLTQEGEGFIKGNEVKKTGTEVMYIRNGHYTTCNLEEPHFSLATSKLKIIPNDKIVTGPTVLKVDNVPTPLGLPFGFFPNKKGRASGIVIPTYGDSRNLGFFLRNGGFYWGINDHVDAKITGDIYSLGSWATNFESRYRTRYRYSGGINLSYSNIRNSFPEFPDFSESREFFVRWNHRQDPKARPSSRFSANVNAGSRQNFRNNLNSFAGDFLTNTFQSSITYTNSLPSSPFNLTVSARHNQNTQTGAFNINLPDVAFNMSRIYPFKNFGKIGNEWWRSIYKNLGVNYSGNATNQLSTVDTLISLNTLGELSKDFRNGVRHSIPISTSFKMFQHFNINPSINYSEVWTFRTFSRRIDPETNTTVRDTLNGLERGGSYNVNTALTFKAYGMFQFKNGPIQAIRHVMTPSVSFNYQPEINTGLRTITDDEGNETEYSIFDGTLYGRPDREESGRIGIGLINNIEMKVKSKNDTTGIKKITLFENLSFNSNYNISADSLNWAPVSVNARTRIGKFLTLQLNGNIDPYALDSNGNKINKSWNAQSGGKFVRLTNGTAAVNLRFRGGNKQSNAPKKSEYGTDAELEEINRNPENYVDFSVPWSLNFQYNIRYSKPAFEEFITQTLNFSGDLSVTENWKVGFNSGWDFERSDFTYTALNINRDLHCWQLAINWIPFGQRQSYNITLSVKSAVLQDLKLNRRRDFYDVIR